MGVLSLRPEGASPAWDGRDRILLALRTLALLAGLVYAVSAISGAPRKHLLIAFGIFGAYSALLYGAGWGLLRTRAKLILYITMAAFDFAFVAALAVLTGGAESPLYRALYLWVAMLALLFGFRGGLLSAGVAFVWFLGLQVQAGFPGNPWVLAVQAGGLLLHGPLIGFLVQRSRRAQARLAQASRELTEEHARMVHSERLSSIGLLASGVAHEINNPLSGVTGCLKALRRQPDLPPGRREEYFETALDGLERIRVAVQGLLDYARERPPAPMDVPLEEAVTSSVRLIAPLLREKSLELRIEIDEEAAWVRADRTELMQAVVNLVLNAAQASRPGGEIGITARAEADRVTVRVADRGAGIPADLVERVFDPFFTTAAVGKGTGLGLSITRSIARRQGGDVEIESTPGQGTAVTLWLPAGRDALADA